MGQRSSDRDSNIRCLTAPSSSKPNNYHHEICTCPRYPGFGRCSKCSPERNIFSTELPTSGLEQVQIDVINIGEAAADLQVTEDKLEALSLSAATVTDAKDAMVAAVDASALEEAAVRFPHASASGGV